MSGLIASIGPLRRAFIAAGALSLIIAGLAVALYSEDRYRARTTAEAEVQAQVLAATVPAALSFGDKAALQEYVDALRVNADVDAAGVFDARGALEAGFTRSVLASRFADVITPATAPGRIIAIAPVTVDGRPIGTVYLRNRTEPLAQRVTRYLAPGGLVLMAVLMFLVMALDARALRAANRDLAAQIEGREKAEEALRQSQKLEAIGRLTGGIAHDFNNMLAIVMGNLELLLRRIEPEDQRRRRLAEHAMEGAKRAAGLTQRLLAFSRQQPLKPTSADIARTVSEMTDLLRRTLGETIAVETVAAGGLWRANIDLPQLEAAIVNLAINARDAMPDGGKLTIETGNAYLDRSYADAEQDVAPGQYVLVAVTDTGHGIPPDVLSQVFEPFFTTKPPGVGTGLGLSQVHGFIKQSGGHVRIYSEVDVGTTVKLYLPRAAGEPEGTRPGVLRGALSGRRNLTVLVVEDEAGVRDFAVDALVELGYDVLSADGAKAALERIDSNGEIALMLTDVVMPEMNGRLLAEEALRRRPGMTVVFMTGYTRNAIVHNGVLDGGTHLVTKPFTISQLRDELEAALAGGR
jgi:signal transduction histidine kinase